MWNILPIQKYLWKLHWELPGSWREKKKIVARVEHSIRDYVSEGTVVSYQQITQRFGEPKQIASTYVSEMETHELLSNLRVSRKIVHITAVAVATMIFLWAGCVTIGYINHRVNDNGYIIVEVIEVERTITDEGG